MNRPGDTSLVPNMEGLGYTVRVTYNVLTMQLSYLKEFLQSIFFSLLPLLFEGSVYFFGKPTDINDGWMRHT